MKLVLTILQLWTLATLAQSSDDDLVDYDSLFGTSPRKDLNFTALVEYDGYESESHTVTTSDGYILSLYRLPLKDNCENNNTRYPIFFVHGLYLSGDDCIVPGPGKAHCYIYADACYDVWILNVRGNRYSRKHVTLNPDKDSKFWDFSFDEMSLLDLPAALDYVLENTGKEKVSYVAHSRGVAMLILLCAKKPEYNDKIHIGFGLSTTTWLNHSRFVVIKLQGALAPLLTTANNVGVNTEFLPHGGISQRAAELLCGLSELQYPFCSFFIFAVLGYNRFQITDEVLPVVVGHAPAGTSLKEFNRWGQIRNNGFSEYDYGVTQNLIRYGNVKPPIFNLTQVRTRWIFIGSENDFVGDVRDLDILIPNIPNSDATKCVLPDKTFGHLDFIYGKDISKYLTPKILSALETGVFQCD